MNRRLLSTVVGAVLLSLLIAPGAVAFFLTTGSGSGTAGVGTLTAPTLISSSPGSGTVALSWTAVAPPTGSGSVTYFVVRDGGAPGGDCPTSASPQAVTNCTAAGLSVNTPYSYTVTAKWASWTATSASIVVRLTVQSQTITFTSTAPIAASIGGATYAVSATSSSGLAVTLTIDPTATSVCSISGAIVSFAAGGTCTIDANQSGNAYYSPASQAQQAVAVGNLYWGNHALDEHGGNIGRANVDGRSATQNFVTGGDGVSDVAVDSAHVYWANRNTNAVGRANLDGTGVNQNFITGADFVYGIAVDGSHVYWANYVSGAIGRANLDGTGADANFLIGAAVNPFGLAVDSGHIYWTNSAGTIGRADLNGGNVNRSFISGAVTPVGVAVNGSSIFWANANSTTIGRADLNGLNVNQNFITGASSPYGLAVDASNIYWANHGTNTIARANLDGTGSNQSFITGTSAPWGVAVRR